MLRYLYHILILLNNTRCILYQNNHHTFLLYDTFKTTFQNYFVTLRKHLDKSFSKNWFIGTLCIWQPCQTNNFVHRNIEYTQNSVEGVTVWRIDDRTCHIYKWLDIEHYEKTKFVGKRLFIQRKKHFLWNNNLMDYAGLYIFVFALLVKQIRWYNSFAESCFFAMQER